VKGFVGARFKKFPSKELADRFVAGENDPQEEGNKDEGEEAPVQVSKSSKRKADSDKDGEPSKSKVARSEEPAGEEGRPVVYTDGACSCNGTTGARGGIGVYWGPGDKRNVSEPLKGRPTNNRAEIYAAIKAIVQAKEQGLDKIEIRTDSSFLIKSVTEWAPGWIKRNWKLKTGGDVVNKDDFKELLEKQKGLNIKWTHVRGHAGIPGNEAADSLAVAGMDKHCGTGEPESD